MLMTRTSSVLITNTGRSPCRERSSGLYANWNRRVKTEIPANMLPMPFKRARSPFAGNITFVRCKGLPHLILLVLLTPAIAAAQPRQNLKALFAAVGRIHNIDADLLEAMAEVESAGDPLTVSPKGAIGLMQLMPATATTLSVPDPFDPLSN